MITPQAVFDFLGNEPERAFAGGPETVRHVMTSLVVRMLSAEAQLATAETQLKHVRGVAKDLSRLLEMVDTNITQRGLSEVMPHDYFVALDVAAHGVISDEARRLLDREKL